MSDATMMPAAVHAAEDRLIAPQYDNKFLLIWHFLTPNVNCSLRRALAAIHWMHLTWFVYADFFSDINQKNAST